MPKGGNLYEKLVLIFITKKGGKEYTDSAEGAEGLGV
tara:strand:- start:239 stop:349 length:111 start_codon:yes stop_codon:yes gene_type:complete